MNSNAVNLNNILKIINNEILPFEYYSLNAVSPIDDAIEFFDELGIHTFYVNYSGASFYVTYKQTNYLIQYDSIVGFEIDSEVGRLDEIQ